MSSVYKATDANLKREVAVKLIHPHLSTDSTFINRFEDEAQAVAQLRHPNIVQVYDFNHDNQTYYMVQEYVPGETLQARLQRLHDAGQRMPMAEAVKYIVDICSAIGYAHARGMIHRDIKPANIMLDETGKAVLMDFGIVKIIGGEKHTVTGAVIGTASYMSPDVIRGEEPDARSDIYSLGVTLYEMVGGKVPFDATSVMTVMMMHLNDPVPDVRQLRPDIPEELKRVIERSLAKHRNARFSTANEMAQALTQLLPALSSSDPLRTNRLGQGEPSSAVAPTLRMTGEPVLVSPPGMTISPAQASMPHPVARNPSLQSPALPQKRNLNPLLLAGGGAVILVLFACIVVFAIAAPRLIPGLSDPTIVAAQPSDTPTSEIATEAPAVNDPTATLQPGPTETPTATLPPEPTPTPTLAFPPTPTVAPGVPFVRINQIQVDSQNRYVVEYETFEYTEILPGVHIHFFFNTVAPDQAGTPGRGPWILYGGPRPFTGYRTSDRPANASQMCALVANANHSIQPGSGTCYALPDIAAITTRHETVCRSGPDDAFDAVNILEAYETSQLLGLSVDEMWLKVQNPDQLNNSCWVQTVDVFLLGDISQVALAESPPIPTRNALAAQITNITLNNQGEYVVEFNTSNFTPAIPGVHVHFYFNTTTAEQASLGGGVLKMHGGGSPFTGFTVQEKPDGATELCIIVANADHSIINGSGNCFALPGATSSLLNSPRISMLADTAKPTAIAALVAKLGLFLENEA
jgi:serine/threonine-protein kinase